MHQLPDGYEPPPWEVLLLDAIGELPNVGTAIVLSATALEVFIAAILNRVGAPCLIGEPVVVDQ